MTNYKAEKINGEIVIKPNIIKHSNGDITVQVPSLPIIQKLIKEEKLKENNGKRNI